MKCALKRMYVNNEYDLQVCKREIQIMVSHHPDWVWDGVRAWSRSARDLCSSLSQTVCCHSRIGLLLERPNAWS